MTDIRNTDPFLTIVNDQATYNYLRALIGSDAAQTMKIRRLRMAVKDTLIKNLNDFDCTPACDVNDVVEELFAYFQERIAEAA